MHEGAQAINHLATPGLSRGRILEELTRVGTRAGHGALDLPGEAFPEAQLTALRPVGAVWVGAERAGRQCREQGGDPQGAGPR